MKRAPRPTQRELVELKDAKPNKTGLCVKCNERLTLYGPVGICMKEGCRKHLEWVKIKLEF